MTTTGNAIFDVHVELALRNGWEHYKSDAAAFASLFPTVPAATTTLWYNEAVSEDLSILTHASQRVAQSGFPLVTVQLDDEDKFLEPLGGVTSIANFVEQEGLLIKQRATIRIFAKSPELTRSIHVVLRGIMIQAKKAFVELGYSDLSYERGGMLSPDEQLVAESAGIYTREQVWSAIAEIELSPLGVVGEEKDWFVRQADVIVDGVPGGVVPYEG